MHTEKFLFFVNFCQLLDRVRRDIQGLFDLVGGFFKTDENGQSMAGNLLSSLFGSMSGKKHDAASER